MRAPPTIRKRRLRARNKFQAEPIILLGSTTLASVDAQEALPKFSALKHFVRASVLAVLELTLYATNSVQTTSDNARAPLADHIYFLGYHMTRASRVNYCLTKMIYGSRCCLQKKSKPAESVYEVDVWYTSPKTVKILFQHVSGPVPSSLRIFIEKEGVPLPLHDSTVPSTESEMYFADLPDGEDYRACVETASHRACSSTWAVNSHCVPPSRIDVVVSDGVQISWIHLYGATPDSYIVTLYEGDLPIYREAVQDDHVIFDLDRGFYSVSVQSVCGSATSKGRFHNFGV